MTFALAILLWVLAGTFMQPAPPEPQSYEDAVFAPVPLRLLSPSARAEANAAPAHTLLGQVIGDATSTQVVDGPAPGAPDYPYVTAGGYLSQSVAPELGVSVEVYARPGDLADRMLVLAKLAPEDRHYSGSYTAGSALLSVAGWVDNDQAASYAERFALALLVLQ